MSQIPKSIEELELFAWVGEDDQADRSKRTGEVGIKQAMCPAGYIPIVAVNLAKVKLFTEGMEMQARHYGKRIRLVRCVVAEVLYETEAGDE